MLLLQTMNRIFIHKAFEEVDTKINRNKDALIGQCNLPFRQINHFSILYGSHSFLFFK